VQISMAIAVSAILAATSVSAIGTTTTGCERNLAPQTYNGLRPWQAGDAVGFITPGLAVDADGTPNSYRVDGNGLSYTCDGVVGIVNGRRITPEADPAHWQEVCRNAWAEAQRTGDYTKVAIFGFLTDRDNRPIVQSQGDPLPGQAYVSTTTVPVPGSPELTQRHWIDAVQIPYIVLSPGFVKAFSMSTADVAVVYRPKTGAMAFAVYGDGGRLGEASVKLHRDLGNNPVAAIHGVERAKRGIDDPVLTVVFPGKRTQPTTDTAAWLRQIQDAGSKALADWGGIKRLESCAK